MTNIKQEIINRIEDKINKEFGIKSQDAGRVEMYKAICYVAKDYLAKRRIKFKKDTKEKGAKQVYYMSMEFLLGRSLKNHLYNLGLTDDVRAAVSEMGYKLDELLELEPDAGLGNGGLGRLAAAFLDSLTSCGYRASGFSIKYDYGIFKQKIVDGWQVEMPDDWLSLGSVWLSERADDTCIVRFGGKVEHNWVDGKLRVDYVNHTVIKAVPYDMHISGYNQEAVNTIRLWAARAEEDLDLNLFSRGEYLLAMENKALAESISKVLYPADDHIEGKSLRLKQQYFFVSASVQSIIKNHLKHYGNLDNLSDKVSIHINDTHPSLCIPELMRVLIDEFDYNWEDAWQIVRKTISYTNHTVLSEALERWPETLIIDLMPRIYEILIEINTRFSKALSEAFPNDSERIAHNSIICYGEIRMANLCISASHTVNGVSKLHSDILKRDLFKDFYKMGCSNFTNVTNGITYRRWLCQANPALSRLITDLIGGDFVHDGDLTPLLKYYEDRSVIEKLAEIKRKNKENLTDIIYKETGIIVNPESIFDIQIKRLHEYKRQLLNALHIIGLYNELKENPSLDIHPRTFIFGAKAAGSYYMAKQIIRLINMLGKQINSDPAINDKLKIVFLENYRVTLAEQIIPAAEVSEQISTAGKEASGTGNMKFMLSGALTIGTMDGANVEINELVGDENMFIFGLSSEQVEELYLNGYAPSYYYNTNLKLREVIDSLNKGFQGVSFSDIADSLLIGGHGMADPYLVLKDYDSYAMAQKRLNDTYIDKLKWNRMSLVNIAKAGHFTSDRSVREYAERIWRLDTVYRV